LEFSGPFHDVPRVPLDFACEVLPRPLTALHLAQVLLEFTGELGGAKPIYVDSLEDVDEPDGFGRCCEGFPHTFQIVSADEVFNDFGARGRRAQAFVSHQCRQFIIFYLFSRILHESEQAGLRYPALWFCFFLNGLDLSGLYGGFLVGKGREHVLAFRFLIVGKPPARIFQTPFSRSE